MSALSNGRIGWQSRSPINKGHECYQQPHRNNFGHIVRTKNAPVRLHRSLSRKDQQRKRQADAAQINLFIPPPPCIANASRHKRGLEVMFGEVVIAFSCCVIGFEELSQTAVGSSAQRGFGLQCGEKPARRVWPLQHVSPPPPNIF